MGQASWPKSSRKGIGVYTPTGGLAQKPFLEADFDKVISTTPPPQKKGDASKNEF